VHVPPQNHHKLQIKIIGYGSNSAVLPPPNAHQKPAEAIRKVPKSPENGQKMPKNRAKATVLCAYTKSFIFNILQASRLDGIF
jgi:hypothetical protein